MSVYFMTHSPKIWLLASPHTGDNTQLKALAENLGWPYETKMLTYKPGQTLARLGLGATLMGLSQLAKQQITAPFPDLVISAGRPTEAIALWIKKYGNPNVKLVTVGTPWARLSNFDLVITTPQYGLPHAPNVLHNQLSLHKINVEKLHAAASLWHPRLMHLPKPWTAILVGGASGPYSFSVDAAKRLAIEINQLSGSALITTSARTPHDVSVTLQNAVNIPYYFHHSAKDAVENPFMGFLGLADQFIVTADSISMMSEACATGKPVMLFDIESEAFAMRDKGKKIAWFGQSLSATAFRFAMRLGPPRWSRDLRIVHRKLTSTGRATWLGETTTLAQSTNEDLDLTRATTRVRALFDL